MTNRFVLNKVDENGNLGSDFERDLIERRYRKDNFWLKPFMMVAILLGCVLADIVNLRQLMSTFLYDSPLFLIIAVMALIIGLDVGPVFLGINIKLYKQKYKIDNMVIWGFVIAFILAAAVNITLRIVTRELAFPDNSTFSLEPDLIKSTFYAMGVALFPIITSIVSLLASYTMADPLRDDLKKLELESAELTLISYQLDSIVKEYEADSDFLNRLLQNDEDKYKAAYNMILSKKEEYFDYVREKFHEHLGDPAEINRPAPKPQLDKEDNENESK